MVNQELNFGKSPDLASKAKVLKEMKISLYSKDND
jgi:hypothetical protein